MENTLPLEVIIVTSLLLGALFGSFVTMASYRLPLGEDLIIKPSSCPKCHHRLGFLDLFPIFSWIFNKGKCRHCKTKVSIRYPLIEVTTAVLFAITAIKYGVNVNCLTIMALVTCLMIASIINIEKQTVPNSVYVCLIVLGGVYQAVNKGNISDFLYSPLVYLIVALFFRYALLFFKKKDVLNMGHIKFFMVSGLFLNIGNILAFLLIFSFLLVVMSFALGKLNKLAGLPLIPVLAISLFVCIINIKDVMQFLSFY